MSTYFWGNAPRFLPLRSSSFKVADSSNQIAAQAFKIAEESNKIAEDSNGIAFESKNVAEQSAQLAVRTSGMANAAVSRDKWQKEMREVTSIYLTAVSRLCYEHEAKPDQAYVEFLHALYLLSLYLTTASRELDRKLFLKLEEVRVFSLTRLHKARRRVPRDSAAWLRFQGDWGEETGLPQK